MLPYIDSVLPTKNISSYSNIVFLQYNNNNTVSTDVTSTSSELNSESNEQCLVEKEAIYVCTFCQVFSSHLETVSNHIAVVHSKSIPAGTQLEDFISKLQSLDEYQQKKKGKKGRSKKNQVQSNVPEKTKKKIENPVPDSKGLFWCKTCYKWFKKPRQLIQHICLDPEEEFSSEESSVELDKDVEFKTHMNIDPSPWSRIRKNKKLKITADESNSEICSTIGDKTIESKVIPNWRKDPRYVPLFDDEKEKAAFEEHLKSIDYSYVDNMYRISEKNKTKNNCTNSTSVTFCCDFCKKECKSLSLIRAHCLIHTDIKPFTCQKCSYKTNSSGSLYFHMRKHTGNVFWCSICDFKCMKRSHLLDHEATHSTVYQTCKLCKNSYKTSRSLINHVRKYHNYPDGKRYLKSLSCKQSKLICNICNKKFKTLNILTNHNHACHEKIPPPDTICSEENSSKEISENVNHEILNVEMQINDINNAELPTADLRCNRMEPKYPLAEMQINDINNAELPTADLQCNRMEPKYPLAEMVLNDFLQHQEQSQGIMYQNVFNQTNEDIISSSNNNLLSNLQAKAMAERLAAESSILEDCQKTLDLDIIEECLQNNGFSNECEDFSLIPSISNDHSFQNNSENSSDMAKHLSEISENKLEEPKSVENKLFEKCQRAPAYVCCVCSAIYICPATLKAHLREHVNSTISSLMNQPEEQEFENTSTKVTDTNNELDVCEILQDSNELFSYNKELELEKLYSSSLDLMYYLPEVSVVLGNHAALFDCVLNDMPSFPINDNPSEDLNEKEEEENVLKMFSQDTPSEGSSLF